MECFGSSIISHLYAGLPHNGCGVKPNLGQEWPIRPSHAASRQKCHASLFELPPESNNNNDDHDDDGDDDDDDDLEYLAQICLYV
jgi:hypothetical protein